MGASVTIVDYRAGNLTSVRYAFEALGVEARVTRDAGEIRAARRVVFPGVGAAGSAMANLRAMGLAEAVREAADGERPFLGICLGMQILFERSEEDGGTDTLGVLPGRVRRFPDVPGFKVPQIGWNQVRACSKTNLPSRSSFSPISSSEKLADEPHHFRFSSLNSTKNPSRSVRFLSEQSLNGGREYYFVHSYYAELGEFTAGTTEYAGVTFTSFVRKGRLWACQFHPEKSGRAGLALLKEFLSC